MLYKDTDSLFYEIETKDVYNDLFYFKDDMDFSAYPQNHFLFSNANKKVPLKLTDELKGNVITEAVFLKPKAYSIQFVEESRMKTKCSAKGVSKAIKHTLHHEKFKSVLLKRTAIREPMNTITSHNHYLSIDQVNKIVLSPFDNKRFYKTDGISSLAYGHFRTGQVRKTVTEDKKLRIFEEDSEKFHVQTESSAADDYESVDTDKSFDGNVSFEIPDPGLVRTAEITSDDEDIVDWDALVKEKPFFDCPFINFESFEDKDQPPKKRLKMKLK